MGGRRGRSEPELGLDEARIRLHAAVPRVRRQHVSDAARAVRGAPGRSSGSSAGDHKTERY